MTFHLSMHTSTKEGQQPTAGRLRRRPRTVGATPPPSWRATFLATPATRGLRSWLSHCSREPGARLRSERISSRPSHPFHTAAVQRLSLVSTLSSHPRLRHSSHGARGTAIGVGVVKARLSRLLLLETSQRWAPRSTVTGTAAIRRRSWVRIVPRVETAETLPSHLAHAV